MKRIGLSGILLIFAFSSATAQYSTLNAHSHNDYENSAPFRLAYDNHFGSIEADIWEVSGNLFVAHNRADIKLDRTLDSLYLHPVEKVLRLNNGSAWADRAGTFQLLIDIKTEAGPALAILADKLTQYRDVFDPVINQNAVRIVITGNRPEPGEFADYPDFILFDGLLDTKYTNSELKRIALYSENLRRFTSWNGKGTIPAADKSKLQIVIDSVHRLNKKIRFWNAPDDTTAWETFMSMGIDYLNTDHILKLSEYLEKRQSKK